MRPGVRRGGAAPFLAAGGILLAACGGAPGAGPTPVPAGPATVRVTDPFQREIDPFAVVGPDGVRLTFPFLGGFVVPRPQLVDVDADGDPDLFIQERTGELIFLENTGTPTAPAFTWRTDRFQDLDVGEWSRFHDLDGDGDPDLLAEERFSYVRYFRNDGSPGVPRLVLATDSLRDDQGRSIFSDRQNIPSLADVDCDGDVDLFLGRVDGTVSRYEEVRTDDAGNPVFALVDARFEDIEIVAQLAVPGGGGAGPTLHGANSMAFTDVDGDGDPDLLWGDYFEAGLLLLENTGSCGRPDLRSEPRPVAADGELIATSGYNAPFPVDLDADGDLDLFVGVLGGAFNANRTAVENLHYYERAADGSLTRVSTRFLPQLDVGSESVPSLTDLDGDGDLDLVVGAKLHPQALDAGRLHLFENTGGPATPRFEERATVGLVDSYHHAPAFADLDGDGRDELLLGTWNDDVHLFRVLDDGTGWVRFEAVRDEPLVELPRGSHSVPTAGDLDGDGDLDLLVGEASGEINHFRNVGTPVAPVFELVTEKLDDIDVGRRSTPVLVDLDADGDLDLVVGREDGGAAVFENVGGPSGARFVAAPDLTPPLPKYAAPSFGDVDADGDLDLISGGLSGGVVFLRNVRSR